MGEPTVEEVIKKYVTTRDEIARRQKELEDELKPLQEFQTVRELFLNKKLSEAGADNIKTGSGTAFFKKQEFVSVADWEAFEDKYIIEPLVKVIELHIAPTPVNIFDLIKNTLPSDLITHGVNKTAILELMGSKREEPVPDGLNYVSKRVVQVRK